MEAACLVEIAVSSCMRIVIAGQFYTPCSIFISLPHGVRAARRNQACEWPHTFAKRHSTVAQQPSPEQCTVRHHQEWP